MSLGQAAGHAAVMAIDGKTSVQQVDVLRLQRRLHADSSATIYTSDVLPGHADFVAVQWWGLLGGLHGLAPRAADEKPKRGKNIGGQYFETYPGHEVGLALALDAVTMTRWKSLCEKVGIVVPELPENATRSDLIRKAYRAAHGP